MSGKGFLAVDVVAERLRDGFDGIGGSEHSLVNLLRELVVALRSYVVEDRHAVGGVVELTIARAKQCIANREDVVLVVVARVPRVPRFHGVERFGFLALVELLEGVADFLFADFARNLNATVNDLLDGIELGVEIRSARSERAVFALVVRRFAFEET